MLAINQILQERYRIVRQLGHGGMGAVYEAIDERFGEPIALKEIIIDLVDEKQKEMVRRAFEREAKSLAKAKHEAVPYVRDYFTELNRQFLVMELVEGKDLAAMLEDRKSPFPVDEVMAWMDQLLDALDYLHDLKPPIIHRDIKPQNLKLNVRGRIKLLDFGIARSGDKSTATMTNQTFLGATLNYSPIEQILRVIDATFREFIILKHQEKAEAVLSQDTDARCDIYALGGTFYHLLTNCAPVEATKRTLEIWEGKPDPLLNPSALNPRIPGSVSVCLLKALAVDRNERYSSAVEMREALKGAMAAAAEFAESKTQADNSIIKTTERSSAESATELLPVFNSAPTEPVEVAVSDTAASARNSGFVKVDETMPSGNFTDSELTSASYLDEIWLEEKKIELENIPVVITPPERKSNGNRKLIWAIPAVLAVFLGLAGAGGAIWSIMPRGGGEITPNKTASNTVVSTPESTRSPVAPTPEMTVSAPVTPTPDSIGAKTESPKPTVATNPNKTVSQAPVKSTPVPKAPKPKPSQDPNCVFTNSCK